LKLSGGAGLARERFVGELFVVTIAGSVKPGRTMGTLRGSWFLLVSVNVLLRVTRNR
jgi:hypothetical protein